MRIAIVEEKALSKELIFELGVDLQETPFSFRWFSSLSSYAKESVDDPFDVLILPHSLDLPRFYHDLFQHVNIVIFTRNTMFSYKRKDNHVFIEFSENWKEELKRCIDILKQCSKGKQYYLIHMQGTSIKLQLKDIDYVEKQEKNLIYHTRYGILKERGTLNEKEVLWKDDGFVRIHHSILLNIRCVKSLEQDEIMIQNGERLPLARSKKAEFKKKITEIEPS